MWSAAPTVSKSSTALMNAALLAALIRILIPFLFIYFQWQWRYHSPRECTALQRLRSPLRGNPDDDDLLILKILIRILCRRELDMDADPFLHFMLLADHLSEKDPKHLSQVEQLWEMAREIEGEENKGLFTEPRETTIGVLSKIMSNFFGIWSKDNFEEGKASWSGGSAYLRCSYFNHSCFPNCIVVQESNPSHPVRRFSSILVVFLMLSHS